MQALKKDNIRGLPWGEEDVPDFAQDDGSPASDEKMESRSEVHSTKEEIVELSSENQTRHKGEPGKRARYTKKPSEAAEAYKDKRALTTLRGKWQRALEELFVDENFLSTALRVMSRMPFGVKNALLLAQQRPAATRVATRASWLGLGVEVRPETLRYPIWLDTGAESDTEQKAEKPDKWYDISQTNATEVISVKETIFNPQAVCRAAMELLDELKIISDESYSGIEFLAEQCAFAAQKTPFRYLEELLFEAVKALAQMDMVQKYQYELTPQTRYISASASYIVCSYFGMLLPSTAPHVPDCIGSEQIEQIISGLDCSKHVAYRYIGCIRKKLRQKKES